ncbi:hypothetical protein CONPUDRAFT_17151, partial [Coniophora puteana RWD-64-598 SS2]
YAIFSHRWGELEPKFTDVHHPSSMSVETRGGPGYAKLLKFCILARVAGCDLAWSDTCCINKDSSAELDENIRSMFRYYLNSHICIAYLAKSFVLDDLRREEWFTRGWTLQELVAPPRLKFFTGGWVQLSEGDNDKCNPYILERIHQITSISLRDLLDFKPGTNRVSEKMSWAAARETTRIEDMAYSLIGIFDVSLTVAYGEGPRAFFRLMKAILEEYNQWDVFAW